MSKKYSLLLFSVILSLSVVLTSCALFRQHNYPQIPSNGRWKCDELNLTLDFGTGYGDLYTENGSIRLVIFCQPNYPDIDLVTDERVNLKGEKTENHTAYFHGEYRGIEEGLLCLEEDGTGTLYWFYKTGD